MEENKKTTGLSVNFIDLYLYTIDSKLVGRSSFCVLRGRYKYMSNILTKSITHFIGQVLMPRDRNDFVLRRGLVINSHKMALCLRNILMTTRDTRSIARIQTEVRIINKYLK